MLVIGRITKDAVVNKLKDERQVVNFSIALNDYYKPKGAAEVMKFTTYINCSYWIISKIAERLKKGTLIELSGRLFVNPFLDTSGNPKASIHCHANSIKVYSTANKEEETTQALVAEITPSADTKDDLPF